MYQFFVRRFQRDTLWYAWSFVLILSLCSQHFTLSLANAEEERFLIYYKGKFQTPYIHYQIDGKEWTKLPGVAMSDAGNGYFVAKIASGTVKGMQVAFNDGNNQWDSRNGKNYRIEFSGRAATYEEPGKIQSGAPKGIDASNEVGTTNLTQTSKKTFTLYYANAGFASANAHYAVDKRWTAVPGKSMSVDSKTGAFKLAIQAPSKGVMEIAFNSNGSNWDNNQKQNYRVDLSKGVALISDGKLSYRAPKKAEFLSKTRAKTTGSSQTKVRTLPKMTPKPGEKPMIPGVQPKFTWENASVYFVLTDRFQNGDSSNDQSYGRKKIDSKGKQIGTFHGGDLKGLKQKIEDGYFSKLGVNAIWLTAPYEQAHGFVGGGQNGDFAHYPYHGYYVLDYTMLDRNMGTAKEMRAFVDAAHARGIRVIMDVVLNHAGYATLKDMEEFQFGGRKNISSAWKPSSDQTYHSYHDNMDYKNESAWSGWWGQWVRAGIEGYTPCGNDERTMCLAGLPDFRTDLQKAVGLPPLLKNKWRKEANGQADAWIVPSAKTLRKDLNVAPADHIVKWLAAWVREYGIDGFRIDTAKHVEMQRWAQLKDACVDALEQWRKANPGKPGSKWKDPFWMVGEVWGHGVDKSDYYRNGFDAVINFSFQKSNLAQPDGIFSSYDQKLHGPDRFNTLSYISSHDTALYERSRLIEAGTALLLAPGAVQIYYGDETARPFGDTGSDKDQGTRSSMNWNAVDQSVLKHWQKIGHFRNRHPAIGAGEHVKLSDQPYLFSRSYKSSSGWDAIIAGVGFSKKATIDVSSIFADGLIVQDAYGGSIATVTNGKITLTGIENGIVLIERLK